MSTVARFAGLAALLAASGCATFDPKPLDAVPFRENAQTETAAGITVSVAVLSERETREVFDVRMQRKKIQPVWLRIQNDTDEEFLFLAVGLDPDYFSPHETSWKNHFFLGGKENDKMDDHMHDNQLDLVVRPRSSAEGFAYTNRDVGVKLVSVNLLGDDRLLEFDFIIEIAGFKADYLEIDFDNLYPEDEIRNVDLAALRREVVALPCCVLGGDKKTDGDPLNLVLVGDGETMLASLVHRGWHLTERLHAGSLWGTVKSSVFGVEYKNSPISPLYLFGRPQDIGLQKARDTVDERNHLRLWLAPFRYEGQDVWVGQISRDIGVRLSRKTFVTHEIDPEVDEARDYVVQDLMLSQRVEAAAFESGVGVAHKEEPRYNYTLSPYFTDGLRAVIFVTKETMALDEIDLIDWTLPPQDFE
jgi:hypothetical protein